VILFRPDESSEEGHCLLKCAHNKGFPQGDRPQSHELGSNDKFAWPMIETTLLDNEHDRDQGSGFVNDVK
jgi:hypothetical protein